MYFRSLDRQQKPKQAEIVRTLFVFIILFIFFRPHNKISINLDNVCRPTTTVADHPRNANTVYGTQVF